MTIRFIHPILARSRALWAHLTDYVGNLSSKHEKTQNATLFGDFVFLMPYLTDDALEDDIKRLNESPKPTYFLGKRVPDDLNLITFGEYSDVCEALGGEDKIQVIRNVVKSIYTHASDRDIDGASACDVWGYVNFVAEEIGRINKLFGNVKMDYSDEERRAGIDQLQFGTFGILDWYAKRMGIVDQNQVNNEKWVRIYQCMKNDMEEAAYNRRLQQVYESDAKRKIKK